MSAFFSFFLRLFVSGFFLNISNNYVIFCLLVDVIGITFSIIFLLCRRIMDTQAYVSVLVSALFFCLHRAVLYVFCLEFKQMEGRLDGIASSHYYNV